MAFKKPEGTNDLFGRDEQLWQKFQRIAADVFSLRGYSKIDTPIIEREDLFVRGIGSATDVVSKEMYSAISGGNLSKIKAGDDISAKSKLALRPEGTAGVVRAICENDLTEVGSAPAKLYYAGPMFRAERPQKGRQRQFYQIGTECLGSSSPYLDAETILMLLEFYEQVGIKRDILTVDINSMGCEKCRPAFRDAVKKYIDDHSAEMCDTCKDRANTNPLRAFDCKNENCAKIMDKAPAIEEYLCDECKEHFGIVKSLLDAHKVDYQVNSKLVRGLDYYTRTVFEISATVGLGSQSAIGGGGRYDRLAGEIGDKNLPGIGFALGFERCVLALEEQGSIADGENKLDVFIACLEATFKPKAYEIASTIMDKGCSCRIDERDTDNGWKDVKSLKAQLKLANKLNASKVIILGPDEMDKGIVQIKDMANHTDETIKLDDIESYFSKGI